MQCGSVPLSGVTELANQFLIRLINHMPIANRKRWHAGALNILYYIIAGYLSWHLGVNLNCAVDTQIGTKKSQTVGDK